MDGQPFDQRLHTHELVAMARQVGAKLGILQRELAEQRLQLAGRQRIARHIQRQRHHTHAAHGARSNERPDLQESARPDLHRRQHPRYRPEHLHPQGRRAVQHRVPGTKGCEGPEGEVRSVRGHRIIGDHAPAPCLQLPRRPRRSGFS